MSIVEIEKRTVTSQKFRFVKLGIRQHIKKEQDKKAPLKKISLFVQIGKEIKARLALMTSWDPSKIGLDHNVND